VANVWMAKEGSDPARGVPWRVMSLAECQTKLGLQPSNFLCDLATIPKFGDVTAQPTVFREPRFVVVQIDQAEADQSQWRSGFYVADLAPEDARRRCAT
jgi:hypothetical protein